MKIVDKRVRVDSFGSLPCGAVFCYSNTILMKMEADYYSESDGTYNCVDLENGRFAYCADHYEVEPIVAELVMQ